MYGRNATISDHYQEMRWKLQDSGSGVTFGIQIRAYNSGVALRYTLLDTGKATISDELTSFVFPGGTLVHSARDENAYSAVAPDAIPSTGTSGTDVGPLTDMPLLVTLAGGLRACTCESSRVNYPRGMLTSVSGQSNTLKAYLMKKTARGSGTVQTTSTVTTPFATPWRVGDAHGHAVMCRLGAQGVGEGFHAGFGGAVRAHHGGGADRGQRGDLQVVSAGPYQVRQERPGRLGAADQIDFDHPAPGGGVRLGEGAAFGDSRVRHDDRGRAQTRADGFGRVAEGRAVGDVGSQGQHRAGEGGGGGLQCRFVVVQEGQPYTSPGERVRQRRSDAACRPGHHDGAVLERAVVHGSSSLRVPLLCLLCSSCRGRAPCSRATRLPYGRGGYQRGGPVFRRCGPGGRVRVGRG